jgi:hypothetical protein
VEILTQKNFEHVRSHPDLKNISRILKFIQEAGILTQENFEHVLSEQEITPLKLSLYYLQEAGMLTQQNFESILCQDATDIERFLSSLHKVEILTQKNFEHVRSHPDLKNISHILKFIQKAEILTQENFEHVLSEQEITPLKLSLYYLQEAGMLTQENFEHVLRYREAVCIALSLSYLREMGILTQENFESIRLHEKPICIERTLSFLDKAGILTQENFEGVVSHTKLETVHRIQKLVQEAGLLTQQNFESIRLCPEPSHIELSLSSLYKAGILTQENFEQALLCQDKNICTILKFIQEGGMLTQENFEHVRQHHHPSYIVLALNSLKKAEILTQENFIGVFSHPEPKAVTVMLGLMQVVGILNQQNLEGVLAHPEPMYIGVSIIFIEGVRLLTQQNFEVILSPSKPNIVKFLMALAVLQTFVVEQNIDVGDIQMLTQEKFEVIWLHSEPNDVAFSLEDIQAAEIENQENFSLLVEHGHILMDEIVGMLFLHLSLESLTEVFQRFHQENQGAYVNNLSSINDKQSTHTTSVQQSVSESATQLWSHYGSQLQDSNLDHTIGRLNNFIQGLSENSEKNRAAKRCITRITAKDYTYTDKTSRVSLRQLLAASYLAVLDEDNRSGILQDAEKQLIEGLYEMQCGGNLSEKGEYLGGEDDPICASGTFNKLIEKLQGVHPYCEIRFMTNKTAALKLRIIVKEAALEYLSSLASPINTEEFIKFTHLIQQIKQQGVGVIWVKIKELVKTKLFNEFSDFYQNKENKDLKALVQAGQYTVLSDKVLSVFQEKIQNSKGYYRYCSYLLHQNRLFSIYKQNEVVNYNVPIQENISNVGFLTR